MAASKLWVKTRTEVRAPLALASFNRSSIDLLLLLAVTAMLLVAQAKLLPLQSVIIMTLMLTVISSAITALNAKTGFLFGEIKFSTRLGYAWLGMIPWPVPLLWITVFLSSRGAARWIAVRWRDSSRYGYWLMGFTLLCSLALIWNLNRYAGASQLYWTWHGIGWQAFLGVPAAVTLLHLFTIPWMIKRRPGAKPEEPLAGFIWLALHGYLLLGGVI